jgi:heme-degrading monooxygenase HmoA
MYARTVRLQLKPHSVAAFTRTLENTIIPLLRTQPGFQDEIAFVVPGGTEAVSISIWHQQADAEAYASSAYPQVLQAVANVVEGTPQVDTYEVSNSTFHKIAPRVAV